MQAPNRTVQSGSASVLAQVAFARADYEEALQWAERSLSTAEAIGSYAGMHRGVALALAARVALREPVDVVRDVETIEQGVTQGGMALLSIHVLVETLLAVGDVGRAEKLARVALGNAAGRLRRLFAALALGDAATRRGPSQWADAARSFTQALALADALGMRSARATALIGRGRLAFDRSRTDDARTDWLEARELCTAIGLTRYERMAAELLRADRWRAGANGAESRLRSVSGPVRALSRCPLSVSGHSSPVARFPVSGTEHGQRRASREASRTTVADVVDLVPG